MEKWNMVWWVDFHQFSDFRMCLHFKKTKSTVFVANCLTCWGMHHFMLIHLLEVTSSSHFSAWLYDGQRIWGNLQDQVHFNKSSLMENSKLHSWPQLWNHIYSRDTLVTRSEQCTNFYVLEYTVTCFLDPTKNWRSFLLKEKQVKL